ncbi:NAD-dependent epimerase/dehydratase family protein [Aestuariispira ectoiniformans]|uniref:NAD-dependent epimerase/dehydratase family protein n=1 Tax=Aestuariispira ectoiniformans TaxID=2775080 RepID=UPI00223B092D|nr:NAD-dependent epimerase/dehydratase family protein [Aestuariispira ectoiniformans]
MKAFITGGCGQVGSHIAEILLARGDEVVSIDNYATGRPEHLSEHPKLTQIEGSIADKELIDKVVGDFRPDVIVHTAASYKDPSDWYSDTMTNCVGGANLVNAAKEFNVGRFIYFQTALCYGVKPTEQPVTLDHPINADNSSYSISKTVTEEYLRLSGIDYVTFRLANVIGPRNVSGPLPIFYDRLSQGKGCFVTKSRRDFVFVGDLARYAVKAADGQGNGTYHFSSGTDVAIIELYDAVVKAMKLNNYPEPEVREIGEDDAESILLDPSRTFADFGDIEFTPLEETVRRGVEYFKEFGVHGGYTHLKHDDKK